MRVQIEYVKQIILTLVSAQLLHQQVVAIVVQQGAAFKEIATDRPVPLDTVHPADYPRRHPRRHFSFLIPTQMTTMEGMTLAIYSHTESLHQAL